MKHSLSQETLLPAVPQELEGYLHESYPGGQHIKDTYESWRAKSLNEFMLEMPEPTTFDLAGDRRAQAVILEPQHEIDETQTLVVATSYLGYWSPSVAAKAMFMRDVVAPNSRMIVLPSNRGSKQYYDLTPKELDRIRKGDLFGLYDQKSQLVEAATTDDTEVTLTGYSQGALTALGVAAFSGSKFEVGLVNADEVPNKVRTPKELQKDFMKSGGWFAQRAAIADSKLPLMSEIFTVPRMAWDYASFGIASQRKEGKAMNAGMANPKFNELLMGTLRKTSATIKLGRVVGSSLFDINSIDITLSDRERLPIATYTGDATHKHTTDNNIVAAALMVKHAQEYAA